MTGLSRNGSGVRLTTDAGAVISARQVALGTNAFPSLLRRTSLHTVPVYDYVLMSEPLSAAQLDSIGWRSRAGVGDCANQFHYYRLTQDHRILWGGYDAVYHYGRHVRTAYDQRPPTFERLATHFFETFPQLEGLRFTHRWGGAIDTCTRFSAFFGTALRGQAAYALGYTGLGVGATRFGARVMLDLLERPADGADPSWRWSASGRCRSRPSPSRMPGSSSPAGRWPAPTSGRESATSGCARSTGSVWASTRSLAQASRARARSTRSGTAGPTRSYPSPRDFPAR